MADATRRSNRFSVRSKQLGQLLLDNGDVTAEQVMQALAIQEEHGGMLGAVLRDLGFCNESAIAQALLKQVQVTDVQCSDLQVTSNVAQLLTRETCETEKLCPFELLGNLLCVVMGNPLNRRAITQIEDRTHLKVKSFKCIWPKINDLIQRTYTEDESAALEDEPAIIENAAPSVELPVEIEASSAVVRQWQPEKSSEPKIEGLENLNEAFVEVIETNRRGLIKRQSRFVDQESPKPKIEKKAKVNVDLDTLDLSQGEVIKGAADDESLEEIKHAAATASKLLIRHGGAIVLLKLVRDSYFYAEGNAPKERTDELLDLIETLPLAEVVAQSLGEYESQVALSSGKVQQTGNLEQKAANVAFSVVESDRSQELQPLLVASIAAVLIGEDEFQKTVATLIEDPVGEWDWKYTAAGPVAVLEYEEN
ncbi:MAG: hypothetical protein V1899_03575 [Planctomycetota bacterium]